MSLVEADLINILLSAERRRIINYQRLISTTFCFSLQMSHSYSPAILSSSSYPIPDPPDMEKMNVAADSDVFLGGLSLKHDDDAEQTNSKKSSSRTSTRKRGRPRLLNKDDNAAEVCRALQMTD